MGEKTMLGSWKKFIAIGVATLALAAAALGQGGATGAITGTVQDPSGAFVANATVRITNQDTAVIERSVTTGPDGAFTAPLMPVGTYSVSIHAEGFAEAKIANVAVRVTETTRMTAKLTTKSVQQKIEVQAEVQTVDTSDATTGQAIEGTTIRALPLATQNFQQLLTLSTGAQSELNAAAQLGRGQVRIQVNGQREDNNNYLIEGVSVTDYNVAELTNTPLPNPDVIQEFKVQTSLYDASQGRNGGGNINAIPEIGDQLAPRGCLRVLPQHRARRQRVFPEGKRISATRDPAEHFRGQPRRSRGQWGQAGILFRELSRYATA